MIEATSYRELTDEVRKYAKDVDVFTVAAIAKPLLEDIIEETSEIVWEEWDCESSLGLQEAEDIKAKLCPEQTIFVIKKGDVMIASYSKSPITQEKITKDNLKIEAERFLTAYRSEYMKQRLVNQIIDELVERK